MAAATVTSCNWQLPVPILSPGSPQESSGILQESVGDNKDLFADA